MKCRYGNYQLSVDSQKSTLGRYSLKKVFILHCLLFIACNHPSNQAQLKTQHPSLSTQNSAHETTYYCPMHPDVQQDHPDICPKPECKGMPLVLKESEDPLAAVLKPVNASVLAQLKTIRPIEQEIPIHVKAQGYIDYDPRYLHNIASRYNGRIDKLYVRQPYQQVHTGQLLMEIYSAEMLTAQEQLVFLLQNDPQATSLIVAAEERLRLQGFTDREFQQLKLIQKPLLKVPVYSRWEGHIHPRIQNIKTEIIGNAATATNDAMAGMQVQNLGNTPQSGNPTPAVTLGVREGMYVQRGQTMLSIADPKHVSALMQVHADDMAKIQTGNKVRLSLTGTSDSLVEGKVDLIEPIYRNGKKSITVRVFIEYKGHNRKIGSPLIGDIEGDSYETLWVPATAVLDLGRYQIVWVKRDNALETRRVQIGIKNNNWVEILDGLTIKDEIAAEAHYLSDSESWVKELKKQADEE